MDNQSTMTSIEVHTKARDLFKSLELINDLDSLNSFVLTSNLKEQIDFFETKYPSFDFSLTEADILKLKADNVLTQDHKLNQNNFGSDPLSRLLAAVLWKNGDINKVQHIVDGVIGVVEDRSEYSLVFKQYGASLSNKSEPIVDQHVLRAFEINCIEVYSEEQVERLRRKSLYKTKDKDVLKKYKNWFTRLLLRIPENDRTSVGNIVDKVIFIFGKSVKKN